MDWFEKIVAAVSPETALKRLNASDELKQRKYAAAKQAYWSSFKGANNSSQNANLQSSWATVTARTRQMIRDFPPFAGAVDNMEAFVVGDGIRFQSLVRKNDGSIDRETCKLIEDAWNKWCQECDESGVMSFADMQAFSIRSEAECGDAIFRFSVDSDRKLKIRALDPATLTEGMDTKNVWFGIEYDPTTMRKIAYHFQEQTDFGSTFNYSASIVRIPAENIVHIYRMKGADQLRGISAFASSLLMANAARDYMQAELVTQKNHSKWAAFITAPSFGPGGGFNKAQWDDLNKRYVEGLEYATVEMLLPGQTVTLNGVQRSPEAVEKFVSQILRMSSASVGIPYEILNGDYREMNYSSLNTVRKDFSVQLKPRWRMLEKRFCRPVFRKWLENAVLRGELPIPDYSRNPAKYEAGLWIPPGIAPVDPVKDANASIMLIKAGLLDPQSVIMNAGRDPDTVLSGLSEWKKRLEEEGLEDIWKLNIPEAIEPVDEGVSTTKGKAENKEDDDV